MLVLDEPTASLDADETELLFRILRDLKDRGIAIVFITHFLDQVYRIADRISVLRNGRLVGTGTTSELPRLKLISLMLGRELEETEERLEAIPRGREGKADPFGRRASGGGDHGAVRPDAAAPARSSGSRASWDRAEPRSPSSSSARYARIPARVEIDGAPVAARSRRANRCAAAMAFCPEDRKAEGIFAELSVRENIVLGLQTKRGWLQPPLRRRAGAARARK